MRKGLCFSPTRMLPLNIYTHYTCMHTHTQWHYRKELFGVEMWRSQDWSNECPEVGTGDGLLRTGVKNREVDTVLKTSGRGSDRRGEGYPGVAPGPEGILLEKGVRGWRDS